MYKNKIKQYRLELRMTMVELSEEVGISTGYLCHLEKGKRNNPSNEIMERISIALKKSITEIFFPEM